MTSQLQRLVRPNPDKLSGAIGGAGAVNYSSVVIDLKAETDEEAMECLDKLTNLISLFPKCEGAISISEKNPWRTDFRPRRPLSYD